MTALRLSAFPRGDIAAGVVTQDGGPVEPLIGCRLSKVFPQLVGHADGAGLVPLVLGHESPSAYARTHSLASCNRIGVEVGSRVYVGHG